MDIQVTLEIVKKLFDFLKESFKELSPVAKAISTLIVLLAFVGVLILITSGCSLPTFLVVMLTIILMATFVIWIAYRLDQLRERDTQLIHTEVNSLEKVVSSAREVIEKLLETVQTTAQKGKLEDARDQLGNHLQTLGSIAEEFSIWKEAEIWLKNNQKHLVEIAIKEFSAKHPDLKNKGRSLDSGKKTKGFEKSIDRHVQWVLKLLRLGTDKIPLHESPVITERYAYREIFEYLRDEVKNNNKSLLSASAKEAIVGRLQILIDTYSPDVSKEK